MINLIGEDFKINQELISFPNSSAVVAIFGTQSTGKSTLLNQAFGCSFPVLNSKITRERCTKGVWFQNVVNITAIDTEGLDSSERDSQYKIIEKQIGLLCLTLADVLFINMLMNEVGRYEGEHIQALLAVFKISERLVASQNKRIVFIVRDCTEDADRNVLKQELSARVNQLMASANKSNIKFTVDYFFMSHFIYNKKQYQAEAKILAASVAFKRSFLNTYSGAERAKYIRQLWDKIRSTENQIDLRSIEDAVKNFALQRIKKQSNQQLNRYIQNIKTLSNLRSYERYIQQVKKKCRQLVFNKKPVKVDNKNLEIAISQLIQLTQKQSILKFYVLLQQYEDQLLRDQLQKELMKAVNSKRLQRVMIRKKKDIIDIYKRIVHGHKQYTTFLKLFSDKVHQVILKYERQACHLFNLFETKLQKQLNIELDKQSARMFFDGEAISHKISSICQQFQYNEWEINFKQIWQKCIYRCMKMQVPALIQFKSKKYRRSISIWANDQTADLIAFHTKLEKTYEEFCINMMGFLDEDNSILQPIQNIKEQARNALAKSLKQERNRFHITLLMFGLFLILLYGELEWFLSQFSLKKKQKAYCKTIYSYVVILVFVVALFKKRKQFAQYLTHK